MVIRSIPNSALSEADIPSRSSELDWREITPLALSFDGYAYWGSVQKCAEVGMRENPRTLTELRTKLFFGQRAARHCHCGEPNPVPRMYLAIIDAMREKVRSSERD